MLFLSESKQHCVEGVQGALRGAKASGGIDFKTAGFVRARIGGGPIKEEEQEGRSRQVNTH